MVNAKKSRPTDPKDDRREGYKLAITMLRELEASTQEDPAAHSPRAKSFFDKVRDFFGP